MKIFRRALFGNVFIVDEKALRMLHHSPERLNILSLTRNQNPRLRHSRADERFRAYQILQPLVFPNPPKEENQLFLFLELGRPRPAANLKVWYAMNISRLAAELSSQQLFHMLGVHDNLVRTPPRKHFNPKRRLLREPVSGMRAKIMNRKHQRIPVPRPKRQIKPYMEALVVDHLRRECCDLPHHRSNGSKLPQGLPQPGIRIRKQ